MPVDSDFNAHKTMAEVHERHEHDERHSPRWIPIAASVLAVLAAMTSLFASQRATAASFAKSEAILIQAKASDTWAYYQSKSIKQHIYGAAIDSSLSLNDAQRRKLAAIAHHEATSKETVRKTATHLEGDVKAADERSEKLLRSHEVLALGVTLFEVAIVMVSISALAASPILTGLAVISSLGGLGFLLAGFFLR